MDTWRTSSSEIGRGTVAVDEARRAEQRWAASAARSRDDEALARALDADEATRETRRRRRAATREVAARE